MGRIGALIALLALLALLGCAGSGMSEAECQVADWRAIGFEDGARGTAPEAFGVHRRACGEHGVAAGFDDYLAGHAEGLERFCQPQNGRRLGEQGRTYAGICPEHLEGEFLAAHQQGYGLYERWQRVKKLRHRLDRKYDRSQELERLVVEKTAALVAPDLPHAQRATLAVEIKHLGEERIAIVDAIRDLEHELADAEHELDHYQGAVANQSID